MKHQVTLTTKYFLNPHTHINFSTASHFTHTTHTFKGIVKSQIIRFHRNSSNKQNFNEACSVLFSALKPRGYSKRFLRKIKSETVRKVENPLVSTDPYEPYKIRHNLLPRIGTACNKTRCKLHNIIKTQTTFKSQQTKTEYRIRTYLNCDSVNVVYLITCNLCRKQYVGQT